MNKNTTRDLTKGPITLNILIFAIPLILGNLLQQMYNIADTWVVGRFLGSDALAAVGSAYALMTFLTSVITGLCMGNSTHISILYGSHKKSEIRQSIFMSFVIISIISIIINITVYLGMDIIMNLLNIPSEIRGLLKDYLNVIYLGIFATFLYNYFANILRSIGNSLAPLIFLAISTILNVILDIVCVLVLKFGIKGAAGATVFSQCVLAIGICIYTFAKIPELLPKKSDMCWNKTLLKNICSLSVLTSLQQSIMNFGILMVQGLVNSFGTTIMAAFAAAVKIDSFAYMPVQDFGNAFSTFVAQNFGAAKQDRIKQGIKSAVISSSLFCLVISFVIFVFAKPLMCIFIKSSETAIIYEGVRYLRIEGSFYIGIGLLFLLYGYYRAINKPAMSIVLTVISLGTRVILAYTLSAIPQTGVLGIWVSVPIGWALADITGFVYMKFLKE